MTDNFLQNQISVIENQINKLNDAIDFLYANPHKRYILDTGQTRQEVTRDDLKSLQEQIEMLLSRRSVLDARCNGSVSQIIPIF